jgi:glycosyl transferase family 2
MDQGGHSPRLSVVLVAGSQRRRAQRVLDALAAQTVADAIQVVIVDLVDRLPRLDVAASLRHVYASRPDIHRWGIARAAGVRLATAEVIGFIEDHCFPESDWAEMLLDAYRGPWAAVGYAFTNANPRTYISRASLVARYGQFMHPARPGPAPLVSGNNVSYRRELLLSFGADLDALLTIDFNLQEILGKRGLPLLVEGRARAAHQNFSNYVRDTITGHWYCRLLAARRAETQSWSLTRRLVHGVGAPLGSPAIRLARLLLSLRGRRPLWGHAAAAVPLTVGWYLTDALGESLGYLFGAGEAESQALRWELNEARESEA